MTTNEEKEPELKEEEPPSTAESETEEKEQNGGDDKDKEAPDDGLPPPPPPCETPIATLVSYFGPSIGDIVGEYSCKYRDFHGKLYVATKAVCFRATGFFGLESCKLKIPYGEVSAILHNHETNDAIIIRTEKRNEQGIKERFKYDFGDLSERDTVYNVVLAVYDKSDPAYFKSVTFSQTMPAPMSSFKQRSVSDSASVRKSMMRRRSITTPLPEEIDKVQQAQEATEQDYLAACAAAAMADFTKSQRNLVQELKTGKLSEYGTATAEKYGKAIPEDLGEAWVAIRDSPDPSYDTIVFENVPLSCDLDTFFDKFLSDGAAHSMARYQQEKQGDSEIEVSAWKLSDDDGFSLCRMMEFTHPVNAPMAPPSARATKEQCFRRFGENGMCLETQTVVNDVPMTDCFYVEDQILLEPRPEGGISMTLRFEVRFIKRTMFRKIIGSTAGSECKTAFKWYLEFLQEELARDKTADEVEEEGKKVELSVKELPVDVKVVPAKVGTASKVPMFLLTAIVTGMVILQLCLILQIYTMNESIMLLNQNQNKMADAMLELMRMNAELESCVNTE